MPSHKPKRLVQLAVVHQAVQLVERQLELVAVQLLAERQLERALQQELVLQPLQRLVA